MRYREYINYLILFILCAFVLLQSPFAPYAKGVVGNDSSIFVTIAKNIIQGDVLYRDIADHKGPVIFIINALALWVFNGNLVGIWVFEVLSMWIASIFMYRTIRLKASQIVSLSVTILSLTFVVPLLFGGNLTEEWALPCISIAMFLFVRYLYNNTPFSIPSLFVLSLTFLLAFLLKASYVCIWVGFGSVIIVKLLVNKRFKEFFFDLIVVIVSLLLVLLPIGLYFYRNGALDDAWHWMISFNMKLGDGSSWMTLNHMVQTLLGLRHIPVMVLMTFCLVLYKKESYNPYVFWGWLASFVITAFSVAIGNRFEHYNIIFAPLLVYIYGSLFHLLNIDTRTKEVALLALVLGSGYLYNVKTSAICNYSEFYVEHTQNKSMIKDIVRTIDDNSSAGDSIIGDDITRSIYVYTHCKCGNKYLSNASPYNVSDEILEKNPEVVVKNREHDGTSLEIRTSILEGNYRFIAQHGKYEVWCRLANK